MSKDQRRHRRVQAALPVKLGEVTGRTRDVSASGVFFETDADYHRGSRIHFEIDLETPWGRAVCDCDGRIVRVERHDGSVGIAVQFDPVPARAKPAVRRRGSRRRPRGARHR